MDKRSHWPLLALSFAGEKGLTPAQMQKTTFLLQKAFPTLDKLTYTFQPYHYGPFDARVYHDVETLAVDGLSEIHSKDGQSWGTYHISPKGEKIAEAIKTDVDQIAAEYLRKLVAWVQSISFQQLIGSIYQKYPEFRARSIFRG